MKHLYNTTTTLQTESKVRIEANYNRTIHGMTKPGEVLYYKAPDDPAEHPMYVDADGRNVPVSPTTLQPMTNAAGNLVDKNGVLLPVGDISGIQPHIDDVRIAVTSSDFDVKDQDGKEILISHDGEIIPTNVYEFPANDFGLYNMAGNMNEWVQDVYRPLSYQDFDDLNPVRNDGAFDEEDSYMTTLIDDNFRVYKGGSWKDVAYWLAPGTRRFMHQDSATNHIGFRCAMISVGAQDR